LPCSLRSRESRIETDALREALAARPNSLSAGVFVFDFCSWILRGVRESYFLSKLLP